MDAILLALYYSPLYYVITAAVFGIFGFYRLKTGRLRRMPRLDLAFGLVSICLSSPLLLLLLLQPIYFYAAPIWLSAWYILLLSSFLIPGVALVMRGAGLYQ
jgi:hypothetical protein